MSYAIGSTVLYRHTNYIVEKFITANKVPTKCRLRDRGPAYNLYIVRCVDQPKKRSFVWEHELDTANKEASDVETRQESVAHAP